MRSKYQTRTILLTGQMQVETCLQAIKNAPIDPIKSIEVAIREQVKTRKLTQNNLLWAGALNDIANQAWVNGRQFSADVWHEFMKRQFLPEEHIEGITKEGYRKWDYDPNGERILIGSTTQLTTGGFSDYLEQVYSYGANLGVLFTASRGEYE